MGLETAKLLASKGAKVSLADVQEKALNEAVAAITSAGGTAMGSVVDVRNRAQVEAWIRKDGRCVWRAGRRGQHRGRDWQEYQHHAH